MVKVKKAKEWAAEFEAATDLVGSVQKFVEEIAEVSKARGGSLGAVEGAVREQRMKFEAILRQCPKMTEKRFDDLLQEYGMDFMKAENKYRKNMEHRKNPPSKAEAEKRQPRDEKQWGKPKDKALTDSQRRKPGSAPSKRPIPTELS